MTINLKQFENLASKPASGFVNSNVANLLAQAALSQAVELSSRGRYDEAEQALGLNPGIAMPLAHDLLARIRAQQGRMAEAQSLWTEAVRMDPGNESYLAGLQRLASLNRHSSWGSVGLRAATVALIVLILAGFSLLVQKWWQQERRTLVAEIQTALQPQIKHEGQKMEFRLKGVTPLVEGDDVVLRFDSGLFKNTDKLTPEAKTLLTAVGEQLRRIPGRSAICVIGYSDNLRLTKHSHFRDNGILALARADAVARFLSSSSGLPEKQFTLQNAESLIYPNDNRENRAKNRSVQIRISPERN